MVSVGHVQLAEYLNCVFNLILVFLCEIHIILNNIILLLCGGVGIVDAEYFHARQWNVAVF